jgi:hypothetical protein
MNDFRLGRTVRVVAAIGLLVGCGRASGNPTAPPSPDQVAHGCNSDADCSEGELCRVHDQVCVTCLEDTDCSEGEKCSLGDCVTSKPSAEPEVPMPRVCEAGERSCNGPDIEVCNADGTKRIRETTCSLTQVCSGASCHDIQCVPGRKLCQDNQIWACAVDGLSAQLVKACRDDQFCVEDDGDASCSATVCVEGRELCDGSRATHCAADGSGPETGGQDCNAAGQLCYEGQCRDQACVPGEKQCQHGDVYLCAEAGTSTALFADCTEAEACDPASGSCRATVCEPNTQKCDESRVLVCNQLGTSWETGSDCALTDAVCEQGSCKAKVCVPDSTFCNGDDVYQCDRRGLTAAFSMRCGDDRYCSPFYSNQVFCQINHCTPGAMRCENGYIAACKDDGSGLTNGGTHCASGEVCGADGVSCTNPICSPSAAFCENGDVYQCDFSGLSKHLAEDCGDERYCSSVGTLTRCLPYDCIPGTQACLENQIGKCGPNGLSLTNVNTDCATQSEVCTTQLTCVPTAVDTLGAADEVQASSSGMLVGDVVQVLSARKLGALEIRLSLPAPRDLYFRIYELDANNTITLKSEQLVAGQAGEGYFSSAALNTILQAGRRYLFAVLVVGGSFASYFDTDPWTTQTSLGRAEGGVSSYALPYPPTFATPSPFLYNVRLNTVPVP